MSGDVGRNQTASAWQVVLYDAVRKARADLPCWCGHPLGGHAGWLICAEREVDRLSDDARSQS